MNNYTNRNMLEFQDVVRRHFNFLESQYGYKCIFSDMYIVKYCSDKAYLNVYHERISYEIYFEIGLLPEDYNNQLKINLSDVTEISGILNKNTLYQASNKNDVNMVVEKLADLIRMHAGGALNASLKDFEKIACCRAQKQHNILRLQEFKEAEEKAARAWIVKDYKTVADAYNIFHELLDPVQLKKLEYARRMLI